MIAEDQIRAGAILGRRDGVVITTDGEGHGLATAFEAGVGVAVDRRQRDIGHCQQLIGHGNDFAFLIVADRIAIQVRRGAFEGIGSGSAHQTVGTVAAFEKIASSPTDQGVGRAIGKNFTQRDVVKQGTVGIRGSVGVTAGEGYRVLAGVEIEDQGFRSPLMRRVGDLHHLLAVDQDGDLAGFGRVSRREIEAQAVFAGFIDRDRL